MTTPEAAEQRAGEAFERARRRGRSEAEAMREALDVLGIKPPSLVGFVAPLSDAVQRVIVAVLATHRLTVEQAACSARGCRVGYRIPRARDEAIWVARQVDPDASYEALGQFFKRDHSTLVQQQKRFENRLAANEVLAARLRQLVEPPADEGERAVGGAA